MDEHSCEKWDKLIKEKTIEIDFDGEIQTVYVDYDSDWSYGHPDIDFILCPYCGYNLQEYRLKPDHPDDYWGDPPTT